MEKGWVMSSDHVRSSQEKVYDYIHGEIMNQHMKPGQVLTERSLCKELNVGRSPVRLALQKLSKDGLIVLRANCGASVATFSEKEVQQLYALREEFLSYALKESILTYTEEDLQALSRCLNAQTDAFERHAFDAYIGEITFFYQYLIEKANNPYLTECATVIINRTNIYLCLYDNFYSVKKLKSVPLMQEMVDGIRGGSVSNVIRAHRKLRRNIVNSYDYYVSHLR